MIWTDLMRHLPRNLVLGPKVPLLMPTPPSSPAGSRTKKKRTTYDHAFKLKVVRAALERPPNNRIKPICAWFPGIEPCQAEDGDSLNPSLPNPNPNPNPNRRVITILCNNCLHG